MKTLERKIAPGNATDCVEAVGLPDKKIRPESFDPDLLAVRGSHILSSAGLARACKDKNVRSASTDSTSFLLDTIYGGIILSESHEGIGRAVIANLPSGVDSCHRFRFYSNATVVPRVERNTSAKEFFC